jgi:hypothetical protein
VIVSNTGKREAFPGDEKPDQDRKRAATSISRRTLRHEDLRMSNRRPDMVDLRKHLLHAENAIIDLNRRLTAAIVWKQATRGLSAELDAVIEARDLLRARLERHENLPQG